MKTFMKWAGNKSSIVDLIQPYLTGKNLIEPFSGSCAVSLNTSFDQYVCNDINADLIHMYIMIQKDASSFINMAKAYFVDGNIQEKFYELRDEYNNSTNKDVRACLFLYLNRHCFNVLCRYNKSGKFNVPFGRYSSPYFPEKEINEFAAYTTNFDFTNESFQESFKKANADSVIYCDPPYLPLTDTADFSKYAVDDFTVDHHKELSDLARQTADSLGCTVIISNHDTEEIRKFYNEANEIVSFMVKRTISSKTSERKKAPELLAIYKGKK